MNRTLKNTIATLALALSACSPNDGDEPTPQQSPVIMINAGGSGIEVWHEATQGRASALAAPETDIIQSVGIFALNDNDDEPVFDNQQFLNRNAHLPTNAPNLNDELMQNWPEDNDWPYSPGKAWVANANYVFVGYTPFYATGARVVEGDNHNFAELVWKGLSSVAADDHMLSTCVGYKAKGSNNPAVQLSLKHLMARLRFCFKLGDNYASLRTIVVKEMKVDYSESRRMTLTATFGQNGDATYRWQRDEAGTGDTLVTLHNEAGVESIILAKGKDFQPLASVYYEPGDPLNIFNIEVVYDVYDSHGQLLRANDRAASAITMLRTLQAGNYYDVRIKIEPSYLYILSDQEPDSDGGLVIP